jgi:hypothetical protein
LIGLREQGVHISTFFPSFRVGYPDGRLVAHGDVQPTPRSACYRVRITYRGGDRPLVHVLSPELVPRTPDGALPHVYPGNRLCLYLPGCDEWSPKLSIARTIIPWTIDWLFHYEMWHLTGEWAGGGAEVHGTKPSET